MTQDEIIEMAMQSEFVSHGKPSEEDSELFVCTDKDIYKFAKLVAEKEREACANVADKWSGHFQANAIAQEIRYRGSV